MFVRRLFKHLFPIIKRYKWSFYSTFAFWALRVFFIFVLQAIYFKKIIDVVSDPSVPKDLIAPRLIFLVLVNILIILGGYLMARLGSTTMIYFQTKMIRDLADYSFSKIIANSYNFFANNFVGSLVTKSRRLVRAFERMHDTIIFNFWNTSIILAGIFVVLFFQAPFIASIFLGWVFLYMVIISFFIKKRMRYDIAKAEADSRVGGRLADVFTNIFSVKVSSATEREKVSFAAVTKNEEEHRNRSWYFGNKQEAVQAGLMAFIQSAILYLVVKTWLSGSISTGTVVLIQTYTVMIFDRLWELGRALTAFLEYVADMKEIVDIWETVPDIRDSESPEAVRIGRGGIEFKDVSFIYHSGQKVLDNFSLTVKPGEKVGLVGHSGAGKSTITKLLLRFVDVSSGSIMIDGQDIRRVAQEELREMISYVPQEPILFHRSIRENIAYSKPGAKEQEIEKVAKQAHAHEFILSLSKGYDTLVGERGVKLSGGERQRVAIARAMLKHAPILILDEATSSLDSVSESYIQDAFGKLMKGKTTIVIAHRLSTIQKMDRIIVLENGKIVEDGTHKELLSRAGAYADLWSRQTGAFL